MEKRSSASKQIKKYSLIVGLLVFIASFLFGYISLKNLEKGKKTAATYTAQSTVRRINAQLNQYVELSEFLGNVVLAGYNLDQTSFSELAEMLPNENGIVKAFELAPNGVVTDIFPQQGNENAFGINMLTDHNRKEDANRAKETGNYILGGPYRLKQGGTGALLFHPVYKSDSIDNDSFWGFVIMVIDWDKFIDEIGLERLNEASYCYEIWTTDDTTGSRVVLTQSQEHIPKNNLTVECEIPNDTWYVDIVPDEGWISIYQWIAVIAVSCITSLMSATIFNQVHSKKYRENQYAVELKKSAEQAREASEAKTRFLFNMSHDIRTPMNAIIGFSDIIAEHPDDEEIVKNAISKIQASGEILLKIINDVLDLSKIESGKAEIVEMVTDLKQMEENLKMMLEYSIQKGMIDFKVEDQIENPLVWCDVTKLQQVLVNVLNNAVKFTPAGGTITFSCVQRMIAPGFAEYKFTIKDTGIGMTEEFQKHAFEAFERERTSTESKTEGTGLGLAIVKKLVDLMHGDVIIQSNSGQGTKIQISLPLRIATENQLHQSDKAKEYKIGLDGMHVLLVEDNELNAEIAMEVLKNKGILVNWVPDGCACVEEIQDKEAGTYQFILMDVQMPRMNGYEATQKIRQLADVKKAQIPIIAMTANAFEEDRKHALDAGMDGFIMKPFRVDEMMKVIGEVME